MTRHRPTLFAAAFTVVPVMVGVMIMNLFTWSLEALSSHSTYGTADKLSFYLVFFGMVGGILGACHGTFRFIRSGMPRQAGVWLFLIASCLTGGPGGSNLNVFPLSLGMDFRFDTAGFGINFIGLGLLVAYHRLLVSEEARTNGETDSEYSA